MRKLCKKMVAVVLSTVLACGTMAGNAMGETVKKVVAAPSIEELRNTKVGEYVSTISTPKDNPVINPDYDRSYDNYEVHSQEGFLHPGILMNREELNIMRDMVWLGAEPWASILAELQKSPFASLDYNPDGPYKEISSDRETYALTRASTAAYELALMWYITGQQDYADKAIGIIMDWADTVENDKKQDHLRMGTSTHKICIAAEIFRYTPSSGWNDEHTKKLNDYLDLVNPAVDKAYQFYNQGGYAVMAFMAKNIFQNNKYGYTDAVERLAYNKNYGWKDGNSVNYSISAMVFNSGQVVEMGRDQEHAWDDLGFISMAIKTTYLQGTKVNELGNIVTIGGEDLYEYDNQKALKSAAYWQRYCMGEEPPFVPNQNAWGQKTEWPTLSNIYRGNTLMWSPSLYYHYLYIKGYGEDDTRTIVSPSDKDPSVDPYNTYGDAYQYISIGKDLSVPTYVRGTNVDFPDFQDLTFTPLAAIYDTPLKGGPQESEGSPDNCEDYNRYVSSEFSGTGDGQIDTTVQDRRNGGAITEPAVDEEGNAHFVTSDIQNGEWISYNIDFDKDFGPGVDTLIYTYGTRSGGTPKVDVYISDWIDQPTQEDYETAVENGKTGTVDLGPTGDYSNFKSFAGKMEDPSQLTGKKTVYFYCYGSNNTFAFHGNCIWFKFVNKRAQDMNTGASVDFKKEAVISGDSVQIQNDGYISWENMDFDNGFSAVSLDVNTEMPGTLKLYVDGPGEAEGGRLIHNYELAATDGQIQFSQEEQQAILGRHDVYLLYEGGSITLNSLSFQAAKNRITSFVDQQAGAYSTLLQGNVKKTEANGLKLDAASDSYVTYMNVPFLDGADTLAVRVKSTGDNTLIFDQITSTPSNPEQIGRGGDVASFELPDTTKLCEDGFTTLYFDLSKTGKNTLKDNVFLGMGASGSGTIEVEYFRLNPDNTAPTTQLFKEGDSEPAGSEIHMQAGEEENYILTVSDPDEGDIPVVSVYGSLPDGFTYQDGKLLVGADAQSGKHTIQFLVSDGEVNCIETFLFQLQSNQEVVQKIIDDSGIEDLMITIYVYNKEMYVDYMNTKEAALNNPTDTQLIQKLKDVIQDCQEYAPVYSKIRFEYRIPKGKNTDNDTIALFLDTTEQLKEQQIAITQDLPEQENVGLTDWVSFTDGEGKPSSITGNHQLTVWLSSAQIRLVAFTLANEDGTVTKTIDAISLTNLGKPNNFCINQLDNTAKGGSFPHEVRGADSWLLYTYPDHEDFSNLIFTGNSKEWPLKGKTGPGFDFELAPKVLSELNAAENKLGGEELYTKESYDAFMTAYNQAKNAVDNYVEENLTDEKSRELADNLKAATAGLELRKDQVSIEADSDNQNILEFDVTGNSNPEKPNQSLNPTVTATAGKTVSFIIHPNERMKNPAVSVKKLGYRGKSGINQSDLLSIEPKIPSGNLKVTDLKDGRYKVEWNHSVPGNYRAAFTIKSGTAEVEKVVEIIYRNETSRQDLTPKYVRMRFAGFRNDEEKMVNLYLVKEGEDAGDNNKIATLSSMWETDGAYTVADWVEIQWPQDYNPDMEYQLIANVEQRNTFIDFFEFATESYKSLYMDNFQAYPLSSPGVMRLEAEHYDFNTMTGYDAVDFNGRNGWENGTPGEGTGSIGTTSNTKICTVKYGNIQLSKETSMVPTNGIRLHMDKTVMMKGDTQTAQVNIEPAEANQKVSYAVSNEAIVIMSDDGTVTAKAAGEVIVTALNSDMASEPYTLRVADKAYLQSLLDAYKMNIAGQEKDYTTISWEILNKAYEQGVNAIGTEDAETVYEASIGLKDAIDGRVAAARMNALNTYIGIAESLVKEEYTQETWEVMEQILAEAKKLTKDDSQSLINESAGKLQQALYGLDVLQAEEVDKTALAEAINEAVQIKEGGQGSYTDESWLTFLDALSRAEAVMEEEQPSQVQVQMALADLLQGMENLEKVQVDCTELKDLYNRYKEMSGEGYTPESYTALQEALNLAKEVLESEEVTQTQIDEALLKLQAAVAGLQQIPSQVDKSRLQTKYDAYIIIQQGNYTDDSWKAFQTALAVAKAVLDNPDADQDMVDSALKTLEDAHGYLVEKPQEPDGPDNPDDSSDPNDQDNKTDKPGSKPNNNGNKDGGSGSKNKPSGSSNSGRTTAVRTGDETPLGILAAIMAIAGVGAAVGVLLIRRRRR